MKRIALIYAISLSLILVVGCQKSEFTSIEDFSLESYFFKTELEEVENRYIVLLKRDVPEYTQLKTKIGISATRTAETYYNALEESVLDQHIEHTYNYSPLVFGYTAVLEEHQVEALKQSDKVDQVIKDEVVYLAPQSNVPTSANKVNLSKKQITPWGIRRVNGGKNGSGKVAWIIDSGVDFGHKDLNVDKTKSKSFTKSKSARDGLGHGTFVAGVIAAKDNNIGVVGVAAGATVVSVRVLDGKGRGFVSDFIAAVDYVGNNASSNDVANLSLGGGNPALEVAIKNASQTCPFVIAAGNSAVNAGTVFPAKVNGNNILTVSAHDSLDNWASFSNYGNPPIDYCQPGVDITSCWKSGKYAMLSGTSASAPHLAGLLLLGSLQNDGTVNNDPDNVDDIIVKYP